MIKVERRKTVQWTDDTKTDTCLKDDIVLELWAASTKHPDSEFHFSDWKDKSPYFSDEVQIYQWLLWCASKLSMPFHAYELAEYAKENWYKWDKQQKER